MTTTMTFSVLKLLLVCCVIARQRYVEAQGLQGYDYNNYGSITFDDEDSEPEDDGSGSSSLHESNGDKYDYKFQKSRPCSCVPLQLCSSKRRNDDPCELTNKVCCDKESLKEEPRTPAPPTIKNKGKKSIKEEPRTPAPPTIKNKGCGHPGPKGESEFPWMVAVLRVEPIDNHHSLYAYQCGGALIHPQVVVTAAHCFKDTGKTYKVRAGEFDYTRTNEINPHQEIRVENVITHYEYEEKGLSNDIALLYLNASFDMAQNVDTICLPSQKKEFDFTKECYVTNWGLEKYLTKTSDSIILSNDQCEQEIRKTKPDKGYELSESILCTRAAQKQKTCEIYRGSPLVCPIPGKSGRYHQIGISAEPFGCEDEFPRVYVNLALFREWIDETMETLGLETSWYQY